MAMSLPTPFRYTTPPPRKSVTGVTADVYAQLASDFGIERPATFVVLSPVPQLLASTWALMRESLIAGEGDRTGKELAALGVSLANRCPFCVDAHTMLLHATGDHSLAEAIARGRTPSDEGHARVLAWGRASRAPEAPETTSYPFPAAHAPAYIGTALTFHFINRIASVLLTENLLPANAQRLRAVRSLGGRSLARTVRRRPAPGAGLTLLDAPGPGPTWARGTTVGPAYAALRDAALAGGGLLDEADRSLVRETLEGWDGGHPSLAWDGFPDRSRPGARLALLTALAPYRTTDEDVTAWRKSTDTDRDLVRLVAYGAFAAVDRVERMLPVRTLEKQCRSECDT